MHSTRRVSPADRSIRSTRPSRTNRWSTSVSPRTCARRARKPSVWSANRSRCRARRARSWRRRRCLASIRTKFWPSSVSARTRSENCARKKLFEAMVARTESETDMNEMAKTDKVLSRKEAGVGYVVFNNPARHNAMSLDMWAETGRIMEEFAKDDSLRVVVLTGAGERAFVSGADISRFGRERSNEEAVAHYNATTEAASLALYTYPKPTIAMIRGYCIGGGLGIAMCCDLRIATENSTFAVPAAKLGLGYGHSGVKRLMDVVGPSFTKEIFYTARQFNAEEAKTMGLVNRVVANDELESYVKKYAETIAGNAPLTIKALKTVVGELAKDESKRDVAGMQEVVNTCFRSKDYIEGRDAFMEKRKPAFTGS